MTCQDVTKEDDDANGGVRAMIARKLRASREGPPEPEVPDGRRWRMRRRKSVENPCRNTSGLKRGGSPGRPKGSVAGVMPPANRTEQGRFKAGQSGNPNGRPPGAEGLAAQIRAETNNGQDMLKLMVEILRDKVAGD